MILTPVPAQNIMAEWDWIGPVIEPAVLLDHERTMAGVKLELIAQSLVAWRGRGERGGGCVVTSVAPDPIRPGALWRLWVMYAAGKADGLNSMRQVVHELEQYGRAAVCGEIWVVLGRHWPARILPDYEPAEHHGRPALRKVLT